MTNRELSSVRRSASALGLAARWGSPRGKSKQVRVSLEAYNALAAIPERDRNRVATDGVLQAVDDYNRM